MKIPEFLIFIVMGVLISCSNGLNDLLMRDAGFPMNSAVAESVSSCRYLGVMYDEESGEMINDLATEGEMYDQYRSEVQNALDVMLRFPLQDDPVTEEDAHSEGASWYRSLPSELHSVSISGALYGGDRRISLSIAEYLSSDIGADRVHRYLGHVHSGSNALIDFGLEGSIPCFNGPKERIIDSLNVLVPVESTPDFCSAYVASFFTDPFTFTPTFVGVTAGRPGSDVFRSITQRFRDMRGMLVDVHRSLNANGESIDSIFGVDVRERGLAYVTAENRLESIYNQLLILGDDIDARKSAVSMLIRDSDEYEFMMTQLYRSIVDKSAEPEKHAALHDVPIPVKLRINRHKYNYFLISDNMWETVHCHSFSIRNPASITGCFIRDIDLLKRLSYARLSLAEEVLSGQDLLRFREKIASSDLSKIVRLKNLISQKSRINSDIDRLCRIDRDSLILNAYDPATFTAPYLCADKFEYTVSINESVIDIYGENGSFHNDDLFRVWVPTSSYGNSASLDNLLSKLPQAVAEGTFNYAYKNYFVTVLSILSEWEIRLRAHIAAGEGL